jgi:hypothetical protein
MNYGMIEVIASGRDLYLILNIWSMICEILSIVGHMLTLSLFDFILFIIAVHNMNKHTSSLLCPLITTICSIVLEHQKITKDEAQKGLCLMLNHVKLVRTMKLRKVWNNEHARFFDVFQGWSIKLADKRKNLCGSIQQACCQKNWTVGNSWEDPRPKAHLFLIKSIEPYSSTKGTLREEICLRLIKPTTQVYLGNVGLLTRPLTCGTIVQTRVQREGRPNIVQGPEALIPW